MRAAARSKSKAVLLARMTVEAGERELLMMAVYAMHFVSLVTQRKGQERTEAKYRK